MQGSCGVFVPVGDPGIYWELPNAGFDIDTTTVSCAFHRLADLPAKLRPGRLCTTATCARVGTADAGTAQAAGTPAEARSVNGLQTKA